MKGQWQACYSVTALGQVLIVYGSNKRMQWREADLHAYKPFLPVHTCSQVPIQGKNRGIEWRDLKHGQLKDEMKRRKLVQVYKVGGLDVWVFTKCQF